MTAGPNAPPPQPVRLTLRADLAATRKLQRARPRPGSVLGACVALVIHRAIKEPAGEQGSSVFVGMRRGDLGLDCA